MWEYRGQRRPPFALQPKDGQESIWDYPRPPRLAADSRRVQVLAGERPIADSARVVRVLETGSPPTFYLPPEDVDLTLLVPVRATSYCEWKGRARYWALASSAGSGEAVAWSYPEPTPAFAPIAGWMSFYPGRVRCLVGGELVRPQAGGYYGGWVTDEIVGPWKGESGTSNW